MFTDRLRDQFKSIIDPAASFLLKIGLTPNGVTILGWVGHFAAAVLAAAGRFTWAGLVILILAPMDALDGAMARQRGITSKFGAFFDSVVDRYSEMVLYGGILVYYASRGDLLGSALTFIAMMGSLMVSYTRARAEGLGFSAKIGLFSRVERYLVLIPALLFRLVPVGMGILALFTNITAVQRIVFVNKQAALSAQADQSVKGD
ncbi:MAG: CDP-alcohol phosphatidyltransferase family protein [Anaerolineaceae bacterium]